MKSLYLFVIVTAIFMTGCKAYSPNAASQREQPARAALSAYVTDFWTNRDTLAITQAVHPAIQFHYNGRTRTADYQSHRNSLRGFGGVFPDLSATIDVFTFDGKYGAAVTTWSGTYKDSLSGIPANNMREVPSTGLKFSWQVQYVFRMEEGRIIELWEAWDEGGLFTRIMRATTKQKSSLTTEK